MDDESAIDHEAHLVEHMMKGVMYTHGIDSEHKDYDVILKLCTQIYDYQQKKINDLALRIDRFRLGVQVSKPYGR